MTNERLTYLSRSPPDDFGFGVRERKREREKREIREMERREKRERQRKKPKWIRDLGVQCLVVGVAKYIETLKMRKF